MLDGERWGSGVHAVDDSSCFSEEKCRVVVEEEKEDVVVSVMDDLERVSSI